MIVEYKYTMSLGTEKWTNSFKAHMEGSTELVSPAVNGGEAALTSLMRALHLAAIQIDSVVISRWRPASEARTPADFISKPIGLPGTRGSLGAGNEDLPLVLPVRLNFLPATGRSGYILLRGAVNDVHWDTVGGQARLNPDGAADLQGIVNGALNNGDWPDLVMIADDAENEAELREVVDVKIGTVTARKLTRRKKSDIPKEPATLARWIAEHIDEISIGLAIAGTVAGTPAFGAAANQLALRLKLAALGTKIAGFDYPALPE